MGYNREMNAKTTYFRPTTAQQRQLLFETWEATGSVTKACEVAHVSRMMFYNWKERFELEGYAGLEKCRSRARKKSAKVAVEIEAQVIGLNSEHPDWGKKRISQELAKANNWVGVISPNTVKRILVDAKRWTSSREKKKGRGS